VAEDFDGGFREERRLDGCENLLLVARLDDIHGA